MLLQIRHEAEAGWVPYLSIDSTDELEVLGLDRPLPHNEHHEGGGDVGERDEQEERSEERQHRLHIQRLRFAQRQGVAACHELRGRLAAATPILQPYKLAWRREGEGSVSRIY